MNPTLQKTKNYLLFLIFALVLGGIAGGVVWIFFLLMNGGLTLLWDWIPSLIQIPFYPVLCCGIGGMFVGIWQKRYGEYPESLMTVMNRVSKEHRVNYDNLFVILVAALLPLIFGGCVGPEAGLTGAIAGLCYWVGDHFRYAAREVRELGKVGVSATLGVIFGAAPLLGLLSPLEMPSDDEDQRAISKWRKMPIYFMAILGSITVYGGFSILVPGSGMGIPRIEVDTLTSFTEYLWLIPAIALGILCGLFYQLAGKAVGFCLGIFGKHTVLKAICGGLVLGISGVFLPYTMFAGETQIESVMNEFLQMGWALLLVTGIVKLIIGQICIQSGFRGGNIFPIVFSGVSIGLALSFFIPIAPTALVAVTTATLCGFVMKKALLVVLVLFLCFPISSVVLLALGSVLGSLAAHPFKFESHTDETA